jgi:hypothetical protein
MSKNKGKGGLMSGLVGGLIQLVGPPAIDIMKATIGDEDIEKVSELVNNMLYMASEKPELVLNLLSGLDPKAIVGLINGTTVALGEHPEVVSDLLSGILSEIDIPFLVKSSLPMVLELLSSLQSTRS